MLAERGRRQEISRRQISANNHDRQQNQSGYLRGHIEGPARDGFSATEGLGPVRTSFTLSLALGIQSIFSFVGKSWREEAVMALPKLASRSHFLFPRVKVAPSTRHERPRLAGESVDGICQQDANAPRCVNKERWCYSSLIHK
jgi:hypothetical protein